MGDYIGILGIIVILAIAVAFSSNRKAITKWESTPVCIITFAWRSMA